MMLSLVAVALLASAPNPGDQNRWPRYATQAYAEMNESFPPPRDATATLAELRSLPEALPAPRTDAPVQAWERWRADRDALFRRRANLIAELDLAGYAGADLDALRLERARLVAKVLQNMYTEYNLWSGALWEVKEAHPGTSIAAYADLMSKASVLHIMSFEGIAPSDDDLRKIADLELAAAPLQDPEATGSTLARAVRMRGPEAQEQWRSWFLTKLPEQSSVRRAIIAQQIFGQPFRLIGTGFNGESIDTAAWTGDVVLIDFWGTWCGFCLDEKPQIARWAQELAPQGFRVLGVVQDESPRAIEYLAKHPEYTWPHIAPQQTDRGYRNEVVDRYGITRFPTYWLIDREGRLHDGSAGDGARMDNLRANVLRLLGHTPGS